MQYRTFRAFERLVAVFVAAVFAVWFTVTDKESRDAGAIRSALEERNTSISKVFVTGIEFLAGHNHLGYRGGDEQKKKSALLSRKRFIRRGKLGNRYCCTQNCRSKRSFQSLAQHTATNCVRSCTHLERSFRAQPLIESRAKPISALGLSPHPRNHHVARDFLAEELGAHSSRDDVPNLGRIADLGECCACADAPVADGVLVGLLALEVSLALVAQGDRVRSGGEEDP